MPELQEENSVHRPHPIYWIASLALAAGFLYYSLGGIEWDRVWSLIKGARWQGIILTLAVMSLTLFLRAMRWRVLLSAEKNVSVSLAFWATATGYLGNTLLPARAGEVVRTMMVSSRSEISKAYVLTTALSERVVDAIVLIAISGIILLTLREKPGWLADAARPFAVLGLCGVAAIALVPLFESFWFRCLAKIPVPHKLREMAEHILRQVLQGIRSFHDPRRIAAFLCYTAVIWFLDAETSVVAANSIGVDLPLSVSFLLLAGLGLGSAIPSTPGFVGIYQFVAVSVLTPFGISKTDAIAFIFLLQGLGCLCILMWSLIGLAWSRRG